MAEGLAEPPEFDNEVHVALLPAWPIWLLTRRLSNAWRDFVIGDLEEEYQTRRLRSPLAARSWFWRQTVRCLMAPPPVHYTPVAAASISRRLASCSHSLADLRYAARVIRRAPSFAVAVISVLAIGIGANTALFSIVNAVLLRPLPFDRAGTAGAALSRSRRRTAVPSLPIFAVSPGNFYDWQRNSQSFEGMALYRFRQFALSGSGIGALPSSRAPSGQASSKSLHATAGARTSRSCRRRIRLAGSTWRSSAIVSGRASSAAAPDVVGRTLTLDDEAYTIVGVHAAAATVAAWEVMAQ